MRLRILLAFGFMSVFFGEAVFGQGKLVFLNGKEKRFVTAEVRGEFIVYQPEGSNKTGIRKADRYNVFSILKDDGTEEIVYAPDTTEDGGDPTIAEARDYILGEQFAAIHYRKPANLGTGLYVGVAGSLAGFYGIPVPFLYSTILGRIKPKMPKSEEGKIHSEAFVAGYQRKATSIKVKQSLLGGGIGFAVGVTWFLVVFAKN